MSKREWKFVGKPDPCGHRFYEMVGRAGDLYVADDSGRYPDDCDDGPVIVRRDKPMRIFVNDRGIRVDVPCSNGQFVMATPLEALWLATSYSMEVTYPAQVMNLALLFEVAKPSF